jgi:hypothetical protein
MLAGVPVEVGLVRELIDRVDEPTSGQLESALDAGRAVVALTIAERILRTLEECPDGSPNYERCCCVSTPGVGAKDSCRRGWVWMVAPAQIAAKHAGEGAARYGGGPFAPGDAGRLR